VIGTVTVAGDARRFADVWTGPHPEGAEDVDEEDGRTYGFRVQREAPDVEVKRNTSGRLTYYCTCRVCHREVRLTWMQLRRFASAGPDVETHRLDMSSL
jgi:hypothetical protein